MAPEVNDRGYSTMLKRDLVRVCSASLTDGGPVEERKFPKGHSEKRNLRVPSRSYSISRTNDIVSRESKQSAQVMKCGEYEERRSN